MSKKDLVILGAGGYAAEVVDAALAAGWTVTSLYDDDPAASGRIVAGVECKGTIPAFQESETMCYIIAIGSNAVRSSLAMKVDTWGKRAAAIVHPTAIVSSGSVVGAGTYVGAGAFVGPNARVGEHALVNVAASVGHDAQVGNFAQICPGARVSGFCQVGQGAFLGSNAVVAPKIDVGDWAQIGACSFVHRPVPERALAFGVPAKWHTI